MPILHLLAPLSATLFLAQPPTAPEEPSPPTKPTRFGVEVRATDGSVMKMKFLDPVVELSTRYGNLRIPIEDIRQIEFAIRISTEERARATQAIDDLGSPSFRVRETASTTLLKLAHKAYPYLSRAAHSKTPEVAARAKKLLGEIRSSVRPELLEPREHDILVTADSKIAGTITAETINVETAQFGEQSLKLADVLVARSLSYKGEEPREILTDPAMLVKYSNQIGKVLHFRVTGALGGSIWGTGTYTGDSSMAVAAVHFGVLKAGETGIVRIRIVQPPQNFQGSTQHGISSSDYGPYPTAYKIEPDDGLNGAP